MAARHDAPETPYYSANGASTRFYDLTTAADRSLDGDVDIYAGLAGDGRRILELGAGTGRVAIALAERGFDVTGVDLAAAMLAQAEAKRARLPSEIAARLRFVRGDLTALALGETFDAVFATYFTLAHVNPRTGWARAFAGMARHLAPGGVVAVHLPVAEMMGRTPPPPDRPVLQMTLDDGEGLALYVARQKMDPRLDRMDLSIDYQVTRDGREVSRRRERFTYFAGDPVPYAARAGLVAKGAPIPLGVAGFIHVFERAPTR